MGLPSIESDLPKDVVRECGQWLATTLGADWKWTPTRQRLHRTRGDFVESIEMQNSSSNRAGEQVKVSLSWAVSSKAFGAWRRNDSLGAEYRFDTDRIFEERSSNDPRRAHSFTDASTRATSLPALVASIHDLVLPQLLMPEHPDTVFDLVEQGQLHWHAGPLFWWFLYSDRRDLARRLLDDIVADGAGARLLAEGAAQAALDVAPRAQLGWAAVRLGLLEPFEPPPPRESWASAVDERGYIAPNAGFGSMSTLGRVQFQQANLERALWSWGEDDALARVRAGLDRDEVEAIGTRCADWERRVEPAVATGQSLPFDRALAHAAVEVLDSGRTALARTRRRPRVT